MQRSCCLEQTPKQAKMPAISENLHQGNEEISVVSILIAHL